MSDLTPTTGDDRVSKLVISAAIAVIVGVVAVLSGTSVVIGIVAVIAAVAAFWVLDAWIAPDAAAQLAPGVAPDITAATRPETPVEAKAPPSPAPTSPSAAVAEPAGDVVVEEPQGARLDPALFDPASVEVKVSAKSSGRAFSIRVAKHGASLAECEDAVTIDPRRAVMAVADGASSSFGSHLWAAALTKQFVQQPPKPLSVSAFATWLDEVRGATPPAAGATGDDAAREAGGWWSDDGARKGAYSTVVGAVVTSDGDGNAVTVMCLGDSCAFVLTGPAGERTMRRSLPYEDASQFGSHPALLGSMTDRIHDEPTWTTVPVTGGDLVILASDAVSEWLLADPRRFSMFDDETPESIAQRLVSERSDGRIVNDDVTVAVLELSQRVESR